MEENEDSILAVELAKAGAIGGFVGGLVPGAIGGYLGAKLAAQFLSSQTFSLDVQLPVGVEEALRAAFEILRRAGRITPEASGDPSAIRLSAVIGSGRLGMNPAIVVITISPVSATESMVVIAGAAKEGLIKQHTAEKAVARVKEMLHEAYPASR